MTELVDNREAALHVSRNSLGLVKDALEEIEEVCSIVLSITISLKNVFFGK